MEKIVGGGRYHESYKTTPNVRMGIGHDKPAKKRSEKPKELTSANLEGNFG